MPMNGPATYLTASAHREGSGETPRAHLLTSRAISLPNTQKKNNYFISFKIAGLWPQPTWSGFSLQFCTCEKPHVMLLRLDRKFVKIFFLVVDIWGTLFASQPWPNNNLYEQTNKNNSEAQRGKKYLVNLFKRPRFKECSELRTHRDPSTC